MSSESHGTEEIETISSNEALKKPKKDSKAAKDVPASTVARPHEKFSSVFNARYGNVVEFMDTDENDLEGGEGRLFSRRYGTQWSKKKGNNQPRAGENNDNENTEGGNRCRGIKIVGTMSRCMFIPLSIVHRNCTLSFL